MTIEATATVLRADLPLGMGIHGPVERSTAKLVLLLIADDCDEAGYLRMPLDRLARIAQLSRSELDHTLDGCLSARLLSFTDDGIRLSLHRLESRAAADAGDGDGDGD